MKSDKCFEGFRVLVTGASGGIGKAVVKELLIRGARVGAHYWKNKPDVNDFIPDKKIDVKKSICILKADLRNLKETDEMFKRFIRWAGGIDGLVNNAGDVHIRKLFWRLTKEILTLI